MGSRGAFYRTHVCPGGEKPPDTRAMIVAVDKDNALIANVHVGWYLQLDVDCYDWISTVHVSIVFCPWCRVTLE